MLLYYMSCTKISLLVYISSGPIHFKYAIPLGVCQFMVTFVFQPSPPPGPKCLDALSFSQPSLLFDLYTFPIYSSSSYLHFVSTLFQSVFVSTLFLVLHPCCHLVTHDGKALTVGNHIRMVLAVCCESCWKGSGCST